jgi:hypothetical protein
MIKTYNIKKINTRCKKGKLSKRNDSVYITQTEVVGNPLCLLQKKIDFEIKAQDILENFSKWKKDISRFCYE